MVLCERGVINMDELFKKEEKNLKKLIATELLAELLYLNYEFSDKEYHNVTGSTIFNSIFENPKFTIDEKENIRNNARLLLKIKYNIELIDFEELIFKKGNNI